MHLGRQVSATELGPRYQADRRHAPYKESRICFSCLIPVRNRAAMRSSPPAPEQSPVTTAARLPRITRLLALAVRFDGLLQEGPVRDYADLARLGGVSRARITQIMSLRGRVSRTWGRRSIVRGRCGCRSEERRV